MFIPLPYKLLAGAALIVAVFFYGYTKGSSAAKAEIAEFASKKTAIATEVERNNNNISNEVQIKYIDRVRTIKEKEYVYRDIIQDYVPNQSFMSNGWVYAHDISTGTYDADTARASDASSSEIKDTEALATISGNYSTCQATEEQLVNLQKWILDNKASIEKLSKK